jgi:hypothetical protein
MKWSMTKTAVVVGVVLILAAGITVVTDDIVQIVPFRQQSITRMNQAKKWALAFRLFADAHGNQLPGSFAQLFAQFGLPAAGLSDANWEMVSGGKLPSAHPSQIILLREKEARQSPRGEFVKAYAFADGHAELIRSPDKDFAALEKQRGFLAQSARN